MYLPKFLIERPESSEEAATLLKVCGDSCLVAGGAELFPRMKYGLCSPEIIVSLKGVKVSKPEITREGTLILDTRMSLTAVAASPEVQEKAPLLAMAAGRVATRESRNMGTLGGNLCQETRCLYFNQKHTFQFRDPCFKRGGDLCYFIPKGNKCWAVFMSYLAPALFCLDAGILISGSDGARQQDLTTCKRARITVGAVSGGPQRAVMDIWSRRPPSPALTRTENYAFDAQTAEVEVDTEKGKVRLLKAVTAHDCGFPINPLLVEGQIDGQVSMALVHAFFEEIMMEKGRTLNPSWLDYRMPSIREIAESEHLDVITEQYRVVNRIGPRKWAKGMCRPYWPPLPTPSTTPWACGFFQHISHQRRY